jgi:hypothetical protein
MDMGSTQPLTEISTRNLPGVKCRRLLRLTTSQLCANCPENMGALTLQNFMIFHGLLCMYVRGGP